MAKVLGRVRVSLGEEEGPGGEGRGSVGVSEYASVSSRAAWLSPPPARTISVTPTTRGRNFTSLTPRSLGFISQQIICGCV